MGNCCTSEKDNLIEQVYDNEDRNNKSESIQKFRAGNKNFNIDTNDDSVNGKQVKGLDCLKTSESDYRFTDLQKKIESNDKLILKILDSKSLDIGTEINLNCLGIEFNGKVDYNNYILEESCAVISFGSGKVRESIVHNFNSNIINSTKKEEEKSIKEGISYTNNKSFKTKDHKIDYALPLEDSIQKHHFDIKYDFLSSSYYIKNYNNSALFSRIDKKHVNFYLR